MIAWTDVVSRLAPGDSLSPLVGSSRLTVDSVGADRSCIRQRLWSACLTRADIDTANRILADAPADVSPVGFSELMRAHYASGTDVTTGCTRLPNLAAVVLLHLGAFAAGPGGR